MDIWSSGSLAMSVMTTTRCLSTYGSTRAANGSGAACCAPASDSIDAPSNADVKETGNLKCISIVVSCSYHCCTACQDLDPVTRISPQSQRSQQSSTGGRIRHDRPRRRGSPAVGKRSVVSRSSANSVNSVVRFIVRELSARRIAALVAYGPRPDSEPAGPETQAGIGFPPSTPPSSSTLDHARTDAAPSATAASTTRRSSDSPDRSAHREQHAADHPAESPR